MKGRRKSTRTSAFGAPGRIGHDATQFYSSKLYEGRQVLAPSEHIENPIDPASLDVIHCRSSECMPEVPDSSVHLMVTSPPYNATKEYDEDLTLDDYLGLLRRVFEETYRKLATGGRACVNLANLGRKPYIPLHSYVIQDMLKIGFLMRGEIIWDKGSSGISSTAWGSWCSPANPTLRDVHEYILVFSKEGFGRKAGSDGKKGTIARDDFLESTKSVWTFPAESARRVGHPAPFPIELPRRLIELLSFAGDVVLDPFCGSGATCLAALATGRHYVGYDIEQKYVRLAEKRIEDWKAQHQV